MSDDETYDSLGLDNFGRDTDDSRSIYSSLPDDNGDVSVCVWLIIIGSIRRCMYLFDNYDCQCLIFILEIHTNQAKTICKILKENKIMINAFNPLLKNLLF